jgi:MOSC domain-containing protein YiiM
VKDAQILSVFAGMPKTIEPSDERLAHLPRKPNKPWVTAIFKAPVSGPVWIGREGLHGDGQANRKYHGGPERAVLVYAAEHYPVWRAELCRDDIQHGAFGENLTVSVLREDTVRIGDRLAFGDVVLQVASCRVPCVNLARRIGVRDMVARVWQTARSGWYCRVLQEGHVEVGMPLRLLPSEPPADGALTVAEDLKREAP